MVRRLPLVFLLFLAACASAYEGPPGLEGAEDPIVWPRPPQKARIKFLYGFHDAQGLGYRPAFLTRVWEVIVGEKNRRMVRPYALAVDGSLLVVADPGAPAMHVFDTDEGRYQRIVNAGEDILVSPVGVAISRDRVYLADSAAEKIFVFDRRGNYLRSFEGWERPTGLAYDEGSGRLYVAETLGHRITVIDPKGHRLFAFGRRGKEKGAFNYPTHLSLREDRLYVNDTMNFRLQAFDPEGNVLYAFGSHGDGSGNFAQPKGVGVDEEGHLYVVDALFNRVQIFDRQGRFLLAFGGPGGGAGDLWLPSGLFITRDRIYVADSYNQRVQVYQFLGGS